MKNKLNEHLYQFNVKPFGYSDYNKGYDIDAFDIEDALFQLEDEVLDDINVVDMRWNEGYQEVVCTVSFAGYVNHSDTVFVDIGKKPESQSDWDNVKYEAKKQFFDNEINTEDYDVLEEDLASDIRKNKLQHDDEIDAEYAKDGDVEIQLQDRNSDTVAFSTSTDRWGNRFIDRKLDKQPRVSSHTYGRIWKDGKLDKQFEGPKYKVRQDMANYLDKKKVNENFNTEPDIQVDIIEFENDDLETFHDVATIDLNVNDLDAKTWNAFTKNTFRNEMTSIPCNGEFGSWLFHVAYSKFVKSKKYNNRSKFGYGCNEIRILNQDIFNDGVKELRGYLGKKLLPKMNESKKIHLTDKYPITEGKFADRVRYASKMSKIANDEYKNIKKDANFKALSKKDKRREAIKRTLNKSAQGYEFESCNTNKKKLKESFDNVLARTDFDSSASIIEALMIADSLEEN